MLSKNLAMIMENMNQEIRYLLMEWQSILRKMFKTLASIKIFILK